MRPKTEFFELIVDGTPVEVTATPYTFNLETRFRVSVNGSPVHIFAWDKELKRLRAIDNASIEIPDNVDEAVGKKLQRRLAA